VNNGDDSWARLGQEEQGGGEEVDLLGDLRSVVSGLSKDGTNNNNSTNNNNNNITENNNSNITIINNSNKTQNTFNEGFQMVINFISA